MVSLPKLMAVMIKEVDPINIHDAWRIFLDWEWHSGNDGCVICARFSHYDGECSYDRSDAEFDSAFGRHVETTGGSHDENPSSAGSGSCPDAASGGRWWEEVIFGIT